MKYVLHQECTIYDRKPYQYNSRTHHRGVCLPSLQGRSRRTRSIVDSPPTPPSKKFRVLIELPICYAHFRMPRKPITRIAGVDEAGRGPLAGPVVAAAAVFPSNYKNPAFQDSKKLSPKQREYLFDAVKAESLEWSIVAVGHRRIDTLNIREASRVAMSLAIKRITCDKVLVDGNMEIYTHLPQQTIVSGDALMVQISAASILAKVWRDKLMTILAQKHPVYGFEKHFGYPTKFHQQALTEYGISSVHRRSFRLDYSVTETTSSTTP